IGRHAQNLPEAKEAHPANFEHVQLDYLRQLSGGDRDFERQLLSQFIEQAPEELHMLQVAIEQEEYEVIRQTAHSLKSTVGYVGLNDDLGPCLTRIEQQALSRESGSAEVDFNYVKSKCIAAVQEVEA